jgi:nitrogen-specific signal transduction histidine kinase
MVAGGTDVIGFLGLGSLFMAHITGNLVVLAARLLVGGTAPVAHLLSLPVFVAGDALCTTKDGGLGLGLSISRKTINAHGGWLWTKKNPNHGATFAFAVPLRQTAHRLSSK